MLGANIQLPSRRIAGRALKYRKGTCQNTPLSRFSHYMVRRHTRMSVVKRLPRSSPPTDSPAPCRNTARHATSAGKLQRSADIVPISRTYRVHTPAHTAAAPHPPCHKEHAGTGPPDTALRLSAKYRSMHGHQPHRSCRTTRCEAHRRHQRLGTACFLPSDRH